MKKSSSFKMTVLKYAGFVVVIIAFLLSPQAMMASGCSDLERIVAPDCKK